MVDTGFEGNDVNHGPEVSQVHGVRLHDHTDVTVDDMVYVLLKFARLCHLTDEAVSKLLKVIKLALPEKNKLPNTLPALRRVAQDAVPEGLHSTFIAYCPNCPNNICTCGSPSAYFVKIDIVSQLKRIINTYSEMIHEYPAKVMAEVGTFVDVQSGSAYRSKLMNVPPGHVPIAINEFVDGASYTNSTSIQTWPICMSVLNLDPQTRHSAKNVIIGGYWHGTKPDWDFIYSHIENVYSQTLDFENVLYYPFCAVVTHDMPGRASHLNLMSVNAKDSCPFCKTQGICFNHHMTYGAPGEPRTHAEFVQNSKAADALRLQYPNRKSTIAVGGSKGLTAVHEHCVVPDDVAIDAMHTVDTGPPKDDFTKLMEGCRNADFTLQRLTDEEKAEINDYILRINWPHEIDRKLRDISTFKNYKASEWKLYVLYVAPTVVATVVGRHHKEQAESILLYSAFVALVSKSQISQPDLNQAEKLINRWFLRRKNDWGPYSCTNKAHELCHIPSRIPINGPIRCYSGYWGEATLMTLGGYITQKNPATAAKQIHTRLEDAFRLRVWESSAKISDKAMAVVKDRSSKVKTTGTAGQLDSDSPYFQLLKHRHPFEDTFVTQSRLFIQKCRYDVYSSKSMANSILYFQDDKGAIHLGLLEYICTLLSGPELCVQKLYYEPLSKAFPEDFTHELVLRDEKTLKLYGYMPKNPHALSRIVIKPAQVTAKCIVIPFDEVSYVTSMSSVFEHN
uniref:DNA helicase n=1 Tax=Panagrellus redivivus TaxID=6233 RepID=A0A7E4UNX5_PANRE